MIVYRIVDSEFASEAYTGRGAEAFPGRWSIKGIPVIYTSGSLALAAMELFVHLNDRGRHGRYVSISATIPDSLSVITVTVRRLPDDWNYDPPGMITRNIGTEWARKKQSPVLRVPSAVVSGEFNYLLKPLHPAFKKIRIHQPLPFLYNPRMWKR